MLKNYFQIMVRVLIRQRVYSFINLLGLALGIGVSGIMLLYTHQEFSYDEAVPEGDRVYRISTNMAGLMSMAVGPAQLDSVLTARFPGVEVGMQYQQDEVNLEADDRQLANQEVFWVDNRFLKVLPQPMVAGTAEGALAQRYTAVIHESVAEAYFGTTNVVGKALYVEEDEGTQEYRITAVMGSYRQPSHLSPRVLLHRPAPSPPFQLRSVSYYTYVKMAEGFGRDYLAEATQSLIEKDLYERERGNLSLEEWLPQARYSFTLLQLPDIHFQGGQMFDNADVGNRDKVMAFLAIGLGILFIAIFNFVNLTTAQAHRRAREVGVRKVLGTGRGQLWVRFVGESIFLCSLAAILALALGEMFIILLQRYVAYEFLSSLTEVAYLWPFALVYILGVGTLAGLYPAAVMARWQPIQMLRGAKIQSSTGRRFGLRDVLVVSQYTVASFLLLGIFLMQQQVNHLHSTDLGLARGHVMLLQEYHTLAPAQQVSFRQAIDQLPGVHSSSPLDRVPGDRNNMMVRNITQPNGDRLELNMFPGGPDQREALGITLLEGRDLQENLASDSSSVLINRAAAQLLSEPYTLPGLTVVGVVEDFAYGTFQETPGPAMLSLATPNPHTRPQLAIHVLPTVSPTQVKQQVTSLWQDYTGQTTELGYLDTYYARQLQEEEALLRALYVLASLACFLSVLGLFGLSAFIAQQRTKEIGVRKVLGASVSSLILLLNLRFVRPIALALVIALPLGYWLGNQWLAGFAYQVPWGLAPFLFTIGTALLAGTLAMMYHSLRAARANPVKSLKYE